MDDPTAETILQPTTAIASPSPSYEGRGSPSIKKGISFAAALILILIVGGVVWAFMWGPFSANAWLQSQMDQVLQDDARNSVVDMNAFYRGSDVIVLDMQALTGSGSRLDVFRVVLQFAERVRAEDVQRLEFAFKGETRFFIAGSYFAQLGDEYSYQNVVYTIRTFPSNVYNLDGTHAYSTWTGGIIGVLKEETEDFIDFHDQWYWNQIFNEQT